MKNLAEKKAEIESYTSLLALIRRISLSDARQLIKKEHENYLEQINYSCLFPQRFSDENLKLQVAKKLIQHENVNFPSNQQYDEVNKPKSYEKILHQLVDMYIQTYQHTLYPNYLNNEGGKL